MEKLFQEYVDLFVLGPAQGMRELGHGLTILGHEPERNVGYGWLNAHVFN